MSEDKTYSLEEVAKHNTESDCWIVIDSVVYNVTKFLKAHPGGKGILLEYAGKDATEAFFEFHRKEVLAKFGPKLRIGTIAGKQPLYELENQPLVDAVTPFAEHSFWKGWKSPYMKDTHYRFRMDIRKFNKTEVFPTAEADALAGTEPSIEIYQKLGKAGILASRIGKTVMPFVKFLGIKLPGGVSPADFDSFHEQIAHEESYGMYNVIADSLGAGFVIGLAPVVYFGSDKTRRTHVPPVLLGDKRICLAISEPQAGSDVAGLTTTAVESSDGSHFILNGCKKWITNGNFADYFVTAARTGGPGQKGLSLFLVERTEGLSTAKIKTSYGHSAGTAMVFYENVKVPKENLLGKVNEGFKCIMANFNHERWYIICGAVNGGRNILADCYRWAMQRKVFGKRLIDQPVIRFKLAQMTAALESCQAWLDSITYQMDQMSHMEGNIQLAGPIALLKYQATRMLLLISDNAAQIFGGRAITRTGMGRFVEDLNRSVKYSAILGGSEEIMADLGVRLTLGLTEAAIAKEPKLGMMAKL